MNCALNIHVIFFSFHNVCVFYALDVFGLIKAFFEGHISDPLSTHSGKRGTEEHLTILVAVLTSD